MVMKWVMIDVMEVTEIDDEYYDSNDFDVETEIINGNSVW